MCPVDKEQSTAEVSGVSELRCEKLGRKMYVSTAVYTIRTPRQTGITVLRESAVLMTLHFSRPRGHTLPKIMSFTLQNIARKLVKQAKMMI